MFSKTNPFFVFRELIFSGPVPSKTNVAVSEHKAKEFLGGLKRAKRQLWDRTRPEVQQWYQQFLYMGFDEAVSTLCWWGALDAIGQAVWGRGLAWEREPERSGLASYISLFPVALSDDQSSCLACGSGGLKSQSTGSSENTLVNGVIRARVCVKKQ